MSAIAGSSKSANEVYEIRDLGKKGKGMVAAKDINTGDVIISEHPIIVFDDDDVNAEAIYNGYLTLSDADRARFKALSFHADSNAITEYAKQLGNQHDKERGRIIAIFHTNAMEDMNGTKQYLADDSARMNHSCTPNATYDYFSEIRSVVVRALHKIPAGEEITIPYVPPLRSKAVRTEQLWNDWGFVCDCAACVSKPLMSHKTANEVTQANEKLNKIRGQARDAGLDPDKIDVNEQIDFLKFIVERIVSIKPLIPDTVATLEIYLHLLEFSGQSTTPEAKKWYGEAVRLFPIVRGPDHPSVKHCVDMLKKF